MSDYLEKALKRAKQKMEEEKEQIKFMEAKRKELDEALLPFHGYKVRNSKEMIGVGHTINRDKDDSYRVELVGIAKPLVLAIVELKKTGLCTTYSALRIELEGVGISRAMEWVIDKLVSYIDPECSSEEAALRAAVLDKVPHAREVLSDWLKDHERNKH